MNPAASGSLDPWEEVKPILKSLRLTQGWEFDRIAQEMRTKHNFYCVYVSHSPFGHWWKGLQADKPSI
jgi:hypothetical protein